MTCVRPLRGCLLFAFILLCFGFLFASCSKPGGSPAAASPDAFDSAPADVKAKWDAAVACTTKSDYLGAVTNLAVIFRNSHTLTPGQNEALQQVWADVGNNAFRAANEGDKAALEAIMAIRASGIGKAKGER
jgi:hypothetical protein